MSFQKLFIAATIPYTKKGSRHYLPKRFVAGLEAFSHYWPGTVSAILQENSLSNQEIDNTWWSTEVLPFEFISYRDLSRLPSLLSFKKDDVLLIPLDYCWLPLAHFGSEKGSAVAAVAINSLKTRSDIIAMQTRNPLKRWKRLFLEKLREKEIRETVTLIDGIQCNGFPSYHAYKHLNRSPLLFFDNRLPASTFSNKKLVLSRIQTMLSNTCFRFVFSGRLVDIKGVDHIPKVLKALKSLNISFSMDFFGDGPLKRSVQSELEAANLMNHVTFHDSCDYLTEVLPYIQSNCDLFLCCHRQGDPSHTYLDMMGCGVPTVGYANDALQGLNEISDNHWSSPKDNPLALAQLISFLYHRKKLVAEKSLAALDFASQHHFEKTFHQRTAHLLSLKPSRPF